MSINFIKLREILVEKSPGATGSIISANTSLRNDLGLDSIRLVDVFVTIEERFDITFDESDLNPGAIINVSDLLELINKIKVEN